MEDTWTASVIRRLRTRTECPICTTTLGADGICPSCRSDLSGPIGAELWDASQKAADALTLRAVVLGRVPQLPAPAVEPPRRPVPAATPIADAEPVDSGSHVSVQSVLAVAGAGLFAVAAIVFTFLNPDLADHTTRWVIIGVITVLFLGFAWMLRRRGVRFSAEAVGALGMVFLALCIALFADVTPPPLSGWVFAGIGLAVAAALTVAIAVLARIRTWLWAGLVGLVLVPAFFGYAAHDVLGSAIGHLGSIAVALALHEAARPLGRRFASPLLVDRVTLTLLQAVGTLVVPVQAVALSTDSAVTDALARAALFATLAVLAALAVRTLAAPLWSLLAGLLAGIAFAILPFALPHGSGDWTPALLVTAIAIPSLAIAALPRLGRFGRGIALAGGLSVLGAVALWPVSTVLGVSLATIGRWMAPHPAFVHAPELWAHLGTSPLASAHSGGYFDGFDAPLATAGATATVALSIVTGALVVGALLARLPWSQQRAASGVLLVLAAWVGGFTAIAWASDPWLPWSVQVGLSAAAAALMASGAWLLARRGARARPRIPLVFWAHIALVVGALLSWFDSGVAILGGVVLLGADVAVAFASPRPLRPFHTAVGFGYALLLFGTALRVFTDIDLIAALALTATAGSLAALVATLIPRIRAAHWYAVLVVTLIPFLIAVGTVIAERTGWTALSTGVTLLLAIALLVTRRPGLTRLVRSLAAAVIVPSFAVLAICLGAWLLEQSGSPVVLPIIAVAIAAVLPTARLIEGAVATRSGSSEDAQWARIAIEASSLVTAAITVLLALLREAAGLPTAFLVLVILGVGFLLGGAFARRRAWWALAGLSFSGALWCLLVQWGVTVPEPYFLPTALGVAVVGLVLVLLRRRGAPLLWSGLLTAAVPSVAILAGWGNGDGAAFPWRTVLLLCAAIAFLAIGALVSFGPGAAQRRIAPLRAPALVTAAAVAAAGPVQGVRLGIRADLTALVADADVIFPALGLSLGAAVIAGLAARLLRDTGGQGATAFDRWTARTRWLYLPAAGYASVGVWWTIRDSWPAIWTMWALTLALLAVVVLTAVRIRMNSTTSLPPTWASYALAWATGVVAWSPRELRVEWLSIPLGLAILAAGLVLFLKPRPDGRSLLSWPGGFTGSWPLLGPGVFLTILPSIVSTGTDPRTERAIWVMAAALVAILAGTRFKLAAPFALGLIVLPIENIVVFAVQIGRNIQSLPWWITLAAAGAVLLAIAVGSERRSSQGKGVAARLRELR